MRKTAVFILMTVLLALWCAGAYAAEPYKIYLHEHTLERCSTGEGRILVYPRDTLRVTRVSLFPWDRDCTQYSLFVEVENVTQEPVVFGDDTLFACNSARESFAEAEAIFDMTTNVVEPGGRAVLFSGVYPYAQEVRRDSDRLLDAQTVEGMADYASRIKRAKYLYIRLENEGGSSRNWPKAELDAKVWIEDGRIRFEATNATQETQAFRTIGAVVSERNGRITDVLMQTYAQGAVLAPGETLIAEKELPPYFTQEMTDGATFKAFAYLLGE